MIILLLCTFLLFPYAWSSRPCPRRAAPHFLLASNIPGWAVWGPRPTSLSSVNNQLFFYRQMIGWCIIWIKKKWSGTLGLYISPLILLRHHYDFEVIIYSKMFYVCACVPPRGEWQKWPIPFCFSQYCILIYYTWLGDWLCFFFEGNIRTGPDYPWYVRKQSYCNLSPEIYSYIFFKCYFRANYFFGYHIGFHVSI